MGTIPIIRLEVEGMKHTMIRALTEHQALLCEDIKAAVEAFCTPEHIQTIVRNQAMKAMDNAVREEVDNFFRYQGKGRQMVADAVRAKLIADLE